MKIIVEVSSCNLWWGIYGITPKAVWEDLSFFYEDGQRIGGVCLNTKRYLRANLDDLRKRPREKHFVLAIDKYLADNQCHYWFYYDKKGDDDFYEVPFDAPVNQEGVKPRFLDIWHPDENIGISTIKSAAKEFAKRFLKVGHYEVQIKDILPYEEALSTFKEDEALFGDQPINVEFSPALINELSELWNESKEEVLIKLKSSVR
mgnify:CR=1 FL=1